MAKRRVIPEKPKSGFLDIIEIAHLGSDLLSPNGPVPPALTSREKKISLILQTKGVYINGSQIFVLFCF